jgi:hypothetical protein
MKWICALLPLLLGFMLSSCRPQNSGSWPETGIYWKRTWGTGIVGAYSSIQLFRTDSQGTVQGPEVGHSDIEVKQRRGANGSTEFVFYRGKEEVVYKLNTDPANRLEPFVLIKKDGYRFDIAYDWAGTEAAVVKEEGAQAPTNKTDTAVQR